MARDVHVLFCVTFANSFLQHSNYTFFKKGRFCIAGNETLPTNKHFFLSNLSQCKDGKAALMAARHLG